MGRCLSLLEDKPGLLAFPILPAEADLPDNVLVAEDEDLDDVDTKSHLCGRWNRPFLLEQHVSIEADKLVLVVQLKNHDGAAGVNVMEVVAKALEHLVLW